MNLTELNKYLTSLGVPRLTQKRFDSLDKAGIIGHANYWLNKKGLANIRDIQLAEHNVFDINKLWAWYRLAEKAGRTPSRLIVCDDYGCKLNYWPIANIFAMDKRLQADIKLSLKPGLWLRFDTYGNAIYKA